MSLTLNDVLKRTKLKLKDSFKFEYNCLKLNFNTVKGSDTVKI